MDVYDSFILTPLKSDVVVKKPRYSVLGQKSFFSSNQSIFTAKSNDVTLGTTLPFYDTFETQSQSYLNDVTEVNSRMLLEDGIENIALQEIYSNFMKSLTWTTQVDLLTIVENYKDACGDVVELLKRLASHVVAMPEKRVNVGNLFKLLSMEMNTWALVHTLYQERFNGLSSSDNNSRMFGHKDVIFTERSSEKDMTNSLFENNSTLRQAQLIIDWLEMQSRSIMKVDKLEFSSDNMSAWENTLHVLKQQKDGMLSMKSLVTQLDPDSCSRQNKKLVELDDEDERKLVAYIFCCIKSGQLDEACKICHKVGHSWRSATLKGWKLYHDSNVKNLGPGGMVSRVEGNLYRDLWRRTCFKMLQDEKVSTMERAVYASLCGDLKSILPVCSSWQDYLWAHLKVFVDDTVEQFIKSGRSKNTTMTMTTMMMTSGDTCNKLLSLEQIFSSIESCTNEDIKKQSQYRYNIIQKFIILGRIDVLMEYMSSWCRDRTLKPHPHLLRFMAHLTLFFRSCASEYRANQETDVLQAYVELLIEENHVELVARYASYLPAHLQVTMYAKFLEGITGLDHRRHCLELAYEVGLDIMSIVVQVVENISRSAYLDVDVVRTAGLHGDAGQLLEGVSELDVKMIDSIEWLLFDDGWRVEAIKHANYFFRVFICSRKIEACELLMKKLPADSIQIIMDKYSSNIDDLPAREDNIIREHVCIKIYLEAQELFSEWFQCFHKKPSQPRGIDLANSTLSERVLHETNLKLHAEEEDRWRRSLTTCAQKAVEKMKEVLLFVDGGWMVDQREEEEVDDVRAQQMLLLRQLCLPTLFVLLQKVLHMMEMYKESVQLVDMLMSQQHQLYKIFSHEELKKYAIEIVESSVSSVDCQLDSLGYQS